MVLELEKAKRDILEEQYRRVKTSVQLGLLQYETDNLKKRLRDVEMQLAEETRKKKIRNEDCQTCENLCEYTIHQQNGVSAG
jgi:hypothetical protein